MRESVALLLSFFWLFLFGGPSLPSLSPDGKQGLIYRGDIWSYGLKREEPRGPPTTRPLRLCRFFSRRRVDRLLRNGLEIMTSTLSPLRESPAPDLPLRRRSPDRLGR